MISVQAFLCVELVAAAALALWVVARFPRLGPKSIRAASGLCLAAAALFRPLPVLIEAVVRLPHGAYVAIFACALPQFVFSFLVAAWLIRAFAGALGGSGRGPGHRVHQST